MDVLRTAVPADGAAADRAAAMEALVSRLRRRLAAASDGGSAAAREKHRARGKLLARDRIDRLLDPGSPFLEIAPLAAEGMCGGAAPGAGVVAGVGLIHGWPCLALGHGTTVTGGTSLRMTAKRNVRAKASAP